jgi:hypothetical protein
MKHIQRRNAVVLLAGVISVGAVQAQTVKAPDGAKSEAPIPAITDWSSRSVIHRKPKMPDEFARTAAGDAEMSRLYRDPRYTAQLLRRIESEMPLPAMQRTALSTATTAAVAAKCDDRRRGQCKDTPGPSDSQGTGSVLRDWSNVLGGGTSSLGGSGIPGVFPAKYNFNITATPSCTNDFVVYPTNAAGASSGAVAESRNYTMSGNNPAGSITIGIAGSPRSVVITASNNNTGTNFDTSGNDTTEATNLAEAVNRYRHQTGIGASSSGATITFAYNTGGNPGGNGNLPIADNLSNFGVSTSFVNGSGTPGQPTIIAFNQLYQGTGASSPSGPCNGAWNRNGTTKAPNTMWAYNTGTGYVVETSPVLSYHDDGKQAAFIQRNGNTLQLVLLKWAGGQGDAGAPATPGIIAANGAGYAAQRGSAGSVMYVMTLNGTSNVGSTPTYSAPFVDYSEDELWVGDGNGRLHKFTGVFQGIPQEDLGNGFPATLEAGLKLSSPVANNGQVYIGSSAGAGTVGGKLYRVNATNGVVNASSAKLTRDNTPGVRESPIIDGSTGQIYTFVYNDNTSAYTDTDRCNAFEGEIDGCRAVIQFTEFFPNSSLGDRRFIGRGNGVSRVLYAGAFDDAFYNSNNGTGSMYIVGGRPDNTFYATLWRIPITNGVLGTPVRGAEFGNRDRYEEGANANDGTDNQQQLSPTTLIRNGSNEYIFVSTSSYANAAGCGSGTFGNSACVYMYNLADLNGSGAGTGSPWGIGNVPAAALPAPGGTGGIVVDNTASSTGSSQIYFSQLQSGGNAIQASQAGLQ